MSVTSMLAIAPRELPTGFSSAQAINRIDLDAEF